MFKYSCFASYLDGEGAAPIERVNSMQATNETGISIMQMNEGLDTGDVLLMKKAVYFKVQRHQAR